MCIAVELFILSRTCRHPWSIAKVFPLSRFGSNKADLKNHLTTRSILLAIYGQPMAPSTRRSKVKILQLVVYTMSTMVFGMICSALGPAIPWLASNADVEPETLGWLPAAQAVMCIASGLASSLMAFVPRRYHHCLLCGLLMWLGTFFMVFPVASLGGIYALALVYAVQVLPRPWIGQMTNLLVSELYEDASSSSAAQSFNQGLVEGFHGLSRGLHWWIW